MSVPQVVIHDKAPTALCGWSLQTLPDGAKSLYASWAAPTGEVFVVGKTGTILIGE